MNAIITSIVIILQGPQGAGAGLGKGPMKKAEGTIVRGAVALLIIS